MSIAEEKKQLRSRIRHLREAADALSVQTDSEAILRKLEALPEWKAARTVLMYWPLPGEVDTASWADSFLQEDEFHGKNEQPLADEPEVSENVCRQVKRKVILPLVEGDHLLLKEYVPGTLVPGFKGIMEPSADAADADPAEIDLAIIPGVAFDMDCHRLGRGKGYYDRTLPLLSCPKMGVAFDWQMVDDVPSDPWDIPLDGVVTPSKCVWHKQL